MDMKQSSEDDGLPNGVAHIRRMTCEEFFSGWEVDGESEIEEGDAEIDIAAAATGMAVESGEPGALAEGNGYDFDVDVDSISVHGEGPSGGLDGYTSLMDLEQEEEEESDDDLVTDSGTVAMVDEDVNVAERLEAAEYDDRFI